MPLYVTPATIASVGSLVSLICLVSILIACTLAHLAHCYACCYACDGLARPLPPCRSSVYNSPYGKKFALSVYDRPRRRAIKHINASYGCSTLPIAVLIDELRSLGAKSTDSRDLFYKIAKWRWWHFEQLSDDPKAEELTNAIRESYIKFGREEARELKKYNSAITNSIKRVKLGKNVAEVTAFDEDLTPFLYVRRLYRYLACLERTKFRNTLRSKHTKHICRKLKKWNVTYSLNLEFLVRLYCVVSHLEGYTYFPILHHSLAERMYDAENMVKFLSRLDSKLAYKFVNEFARFEIYIGNHSRVSKLLDIYRCNLGIGLDTGPCFGSERDLIAEAIKLYQENEKERGEYQIVYDDLATYTELAITLSRDIAAKGHLEESHRIISELIYTMKRLAVAQGAEDRLAHEIRNCSLYSLSILLNNAVMRSTQGYSDTSDKVLLQMSILPILEFFSALKLEDLPQPISLYIKGALVLAICNMGKDYQSIDSPAVNSDELRTFTHLLEVIVKSNPKYTAIGRKMVSMYEFNLEFQRARKFIDQYNIRVPKGTTEVLAYKEKLLHDYGTISNIPIGTPFPLVKLEPLDPILIYDHAYEYKCDLYNKIVDKPLTLDDCVWVIAREINSSGNGGQGLLLNVGGDQIYGIWSRVGTCLSGFFPSYNYKIMDLHNSNLDGITIAGTNDCVWRLHAIVDLMMAHPLNLAKDYGTARELAQHIYNIVKIKCEYLFEKCVLVDSVSMLVDPHTHNSKVSNSGQTVANFSDLKSSDAINHRKFKDIITVKL